MASYVGHLTFSTALGAAYGAAGAVAMNLDWGPAFLGASLTAVGGLLPDLDSQSGVPVRELFGLGAVVVPFMLVHRIGAHGFTPEQTLAIMFALYITIRYGVSAVFKKLTVHRGIYHSIPAMVIAGLIVFLCYHSPNVNLRLYLAAGTMLGFLSHLVLDELCSVDFNGVSIKLNQFAGSALKIKSHSWGVTFATYALLLGLGWLAYQDVERNPTYDRQVRDTLLNIRTRISAAVR
jgi:membrane-bound metal-dependent hydrolase YbcI (DUF457 family)